MKTSLKTGFVQIFSCCPKKSELPKIWGGCSPPRPPARRPMQLRYHLFFFSSNLEVLHGFFRLFLCSVSVSTVVIVVYFLLLVVCFFLFFFLSNCNFCVRCPFRIFCFIFAEKEFKYQTSKYLSLFRYILSTARRQSFFKESLQVCRFFFYIISRSSYSLNYFSNSVIIHKKNSKEIN